MLRINGSARSRAQRTLWMTFELGIPVTMPLERPVASFPRCTKTPGFWR